MSDALRYYEESYPPSVYAGEPVAPTLTTIAPTTSPLASQPFTLTCTGTGVTASTLVKVDGNSVPTTYVNGTSCTASISGLTTGTHAVTLSDTAGSSGPRTLTITATGTEEASEASVEPSAESVPFEPDPVPVSPPEAT